MYTIDTDTARLDTDLIHNFLTTEAYWSRGIPRSVVETAIANSLCFGAYDAERQVGFARVVTDYATFGYLADVFVLPGHRGRGVARRLMEAIMEHPSLSSLRRWSLVTRDAQPLYRQFGLPLSRIPTATWNPSVPTRIEPPWSQPGKGFRPASVRLQT